MELFFRQYGEGRPVIILHGLFGMSDNWATFSKNLSEKNYAVFVPDLRNHGNSPQSELFNFKVLVNDLNEFIQQHNINNPVLIGHSLGGKIVMNFALEFQKIASKVIIIDMGIREIGIQNKEVLDAMINCNISSKKTRKEIEEALARKIRQRKVLQFLMKNVKRNNNNTFGWKPNLQVLRNNFFEILKTIEVTAKSDIPSLFIAAENSEYISENDLPAIQKNFPSSKYLCIPGSTHWVHADKPDELLNAINRFIEKD